MPLLITRTPVQEIQADMIINIRQKEHSDTMIKAKKELGWDFLFLGANIDAAREAD